MNSVQIVADNGCDIRPELAARHNIRIVPLMVRFGQEAVWDADMSPDEFWTRQERTGQIPGTGAPAPEVFAGVFRPLVEAGRDVLCFTLPGNYSAVYNTAWLAAQEFDGRVRVIDSGSITVGIGLQALAAARRAQAGAPLDEIYESAEKMRQRTSVIFSLETLEWVRRGGRLERLLPLVDRVARTFRVRPIVELANGDMRLLGVARSYRGALQRVEDEVRSRLPLEAMATAYTRTREPAVELSDRLGQALNLPSSELNLQEAGPVFAAHAGPNAFGVAIVRA